MGRRAAAWAVAFVSAGSMAFEILLVRVFAIEYFHHFAYLAVGIAMLGFGLGGTALSLRPRATDDARSTWLGWSVAIAPLALAASPALAHRVPLDPTQLAWSPAQWPMLALTELILAVPFVACGLVVLLALASAGGRPGGIYAAGFLGSAGGAAVAIASLAVVAPDRALAVPALLAAVGSAGVAGFARGARGAARHAARIAVLAAIAAAVLPLWRIAVTPYKALPQVEAFPGARRAAEEPSPLGWLVEVEAPAFRYAPGLSLAYRGEFPRQRGLFVDGGLAGALSGGGAGVAPCCVPNFVALVDHLPTAAPYALGGRDRVLVIGAGEGLEAPGAAWHGARYTTAVELHPGLAHRAASQGPEVPGGWIRWVVGDARGHLARSADRYDLITIGVGGTLGAAAAGLHSLDEDFLHTTDAYALYLSRLADGGILSITRWLAGPPREPVRTILTACEALRRADPSSPPRALIVIRSWATVTVLLRPSGFTPEQVDRLRGWCDARQFDLDWFPGIERPPAAPFNALERPVLFDAARAGVAGAVEADAFAAGYPFLVAPVPDARPYAHHFLRPGSVGALLRSDRAAWLPLAEWGVLALLATLAVALALAALLLLAPALAPATRGTVPGMPRVVAYFAAIGFGYLAAEIAAIQQLGLLLGHPVYAVAATLVALLLGSGLGSLASDRLGPRGLRRTMALLVVVLAAEAALLPEVVRVAQAAALPARAAVALAALLPPAFLMGLPFPLGLRALARGGTVRIAWAWAANGFASVVAAPLAALIALEWGSAVLFASAAGAYALALLASAGGASAGGASAAHGDDARTQETPAAPAAGVPSVSRSQERATS